MADKLAVEQLRIHESLMAFYRTRFATDHQFISQYFLPNQSDINVQKTENIASWTQNIYDTTPILAAQVLAAGMYNMGTPPNQPWAEYDVPSDLKDEEGEADDDAVQFLGKASSTIMTEIGRSNFYSVKGMSDLCLAVFGTDTMIFDEGEGRELFQFSHCKISTYSIEQDYMGIVDTLRREIKMTYRQIEQKFGKPDDVIPDEMARQSKGPDGAQKEFKILHCIYPRQENARRPKGKTGKDKPIASVYISMDFKIVMRESGYDESPILCRRFATWGTGTVWGYGPAYLAMPDARQLNYVQQYLDAMAEKHAYPPVLIPDNLDGDVDLRAGGVTTFDSSNPNAKPSEWITYADYKLGLDMQEQRRQQVRDGFFVDAFKLLNSAPLIDKEMTAYEISQRQAEQLQGVAPAFTRSNPEFITPVMTRAFGIAFRANKLGQIPDSMKVPVGPGKVATAQPEVIVTSRFNDALRALKNRGTEETMKFAAPLAEIKQDIWDNFDMDDVVREYARNAGMPPDSLRKEKGPNSIADIRGQRAKIMQEQRQMQQAQQASDAAGKLGKAPPWLQEQVQHQVA
jgi:hypothetical protein